MDKTKQVTHIRFWILILMLGLIISGVTAFPLRVEVAWVYSLYSDTTFATVFPGLLHWLGRIRDALNTIQQDEPFIFYSTDWLAYAHLIIATAFLGPLRNPVKNIWVLQWGIIACVGIIPLALIAGSIRGIPFFWQCIDMSFGVVGIVPALLAYLGAKKLERTS